MIDTCGAPRVNLITVVLHVSFFAEKRRKIEKSKIFQKRTSSLCKFVLTPKFAGCWQYGGNYGK